jgi:hypothetical protein
LDTTQLEEYHMKRIWCLNLLFLVLVPGVLPAADDTKDKEKPPKPPTSQEQFQAVVAEVRKEQGEVIKAYREAKTEAEREKAIQNYMKKPQAFAARVLEIAEMNPKDNVAFEALAWIAENVPDGAELDKAVAILLKEHLDKLGPVCAALAQSTSPATEKLLRSVMEKSSKADVQAQASLALGHRLKIQAESPDRTADADKLYKEADELLGRLVDKHADLKGLVEQAKGLLFEIRNLAVGKTAPEIVGEDTDGKPLKLTDYRGKVVVLDFWGNW